MATNDIKRASVHDWKAEMLRATAFFPPNAQFKSETWWRDVVGSDPDTSTFRSKVGESVQQGMALGGQLTLRIQQSRVDWFLNPAQPSSSETEPSEPVTAVGPFDETYSQFCGLIRRWLHMDIPEQIRMAFGAVVLLEVRDRIHGYRQLIPYLPNVTIDPDGTSDFLYRINRWQSSESGIKNLRINRLTSWSVASLEFKRLRVSGENFDVLGAQPVFFCRVELDINTSPDFSGSFSAPQSATIFDELSRLGAEIVEKGDVS